ncbi:hypothetical protein C8F01DRAFT_1342162 [Mycena amicta]|nr:hypothetical protein C8F01DRAFT_1342162 [Mycena amicta]
MCWQLRRWHNFDLCPNLQNDRDTDLPRSTHEVSACLSRANINQQFVIQKVTECTHLSSLTGTPAAAELVKSVHTTLHAEYAKHHRHFVQIVDKLAKIHKLEKQGRATHNEDIGGEEHGTEQLDDVLGQVFNEHWATHCTIMRNSKCTTTPAPPAGQKPLGLRRQDHPLAQSEDTHVILGLGKQELNSRGPAKAAEELFAVPNQVLYDMVTRRQQELQEAGSRIGMYRLLLHQVFSATQNKFVFNQLLSSQVSQVNYTYRDSNLAILHRVFHHPCWQELKSMLKKIQYGGRLDIMAVWVFLILYLANTAAETSPTPFDIAA